ncbi:hypothetical protein BDF14DRAFT_1721035 [Spinellus fusiger]|nr:hypothetical protein BDF14DRAFT_1721035 [Spinellus fusiger]
MYLASSYSRYPPVHTRHQVLRKCCGLVHLRTGAILTCLVWATLSFYFAILSFQNTSIFFSYLPSGGAIAFRVSNVLLGGVSLGGLLTVIADKPDLLRPFSHAAWVSVFAVLVSGFVNGVLFITHYDAYQAWCIQVSSQSILQSVAIEQPDQTIGFALDKDYYNCDGLWRDETKFSSVAIVLMVVLYVSKPILPIH